MFYQVFLLISEKLEDCFDSCGKLLLAWSGVELGARKVGSVRLILS